MFRGNSDLRVSVVCLRIISMRTYVKIIIMLYRMFLWRSASHITDPSYGIKLMIKISIRRCNRRRFNVTICASRVYSTRKIQLLSWGSYKMAAILQAIFFKVIVMKVIVIVFKYHFVLRDLNRRPVTIDSDDGLAPHRWQTIIWDTKVP